MGRKLRIGRGPSAEETPAGPSGDARPAMPDPKACTGYTRKRARIRLTTTATNLLRELAWITAAIDR